LGSAAHLLFLRAGEASPELSFVIDEWSRLDPFHWPPADLPPGRVGWLTYLLVSVATLTAIGAAVRLWRRGEEDGRLTNVDGALVALALVGVIAPCVVCRHRRTPSSTKHRAAKPSPTMNEFAARETVSRATAE